MAIGRGTPAQARDTTLDAYEPGTIVVKTAERKLFLVLSHGQVLTYPVAVVFRRWVGRGMGAFAFVELFLFVAILALGLAYVWRHGDLEWIKATH